MSDKSSQITGKRKEITEDNLLYSLFNPYLFHEAKVNIYLYERLMIRRNHPEKSKVRTLVRLIRENEYKDITSHLIENTFELSTPEEKNCIWEDIERFKQISKADIQGYRNRYRETCLNELILSSNEFSSAEDKINYLKEHEYKDSFSTQIRVMSFDEAADSGDDVLMASGIHAPLRFIDNTSPLNQYLSGQLVCFTGDTKVMTDKGHIRFDELTRRFNEGEKFKTWTWDFGLEDFVESNIINSFITKKSLTYDVIIFSELEVKCTSDHRFLVDSDEGLVWKEAGQLKIGDRVKSLNGYEVVQGCLRDVISPYTGKVGSEFGMSDGEPLYDLTVDHEDHNFMLENECIVKNCVSAPPGCFTGDTKVRLYDGTSITFEELSDRIQNEEFYTFSCDEKGNSIKSKVVKCWVTKETDDLVEVFVDNNTSVRCTPDHRFQLRDGSYKEAKDLNPGDSLMSDWRYNRYSLKDLYERSDDYRNFLDLKGHKIYLIKNEVTGKYYVGKNNSTLYHRFHKHHYYTGHFQMYDTLSEVGLRKQHHLYNSMKKYGLDKFSVRVLSYDEDSVEKKYIQLYDSFENGYNRTPDGESINSEYSQAGFKCMVKDEKLIRIPPEEVPLYESDGWELGVPKWMSQKAQKTRELRGSGFSNFEVCSKGGKIGAKVGFERGTNVLSNPILRAEAARKGLESQRLNKTGIYSREVRLRAARKVSEKWKSGELKMSPLHEAHVVSLRRRAAEVQVEWGLKVMDKVLSNNLPLTEENYKMYRTTMDRRYDRISTWNTMMSKMTQVQKIQYGLDNHKVVKVQSIKLDEPIKVYDLEVDSEYHNFMLHDCEVYCHNSGKSLILMHQAAIAANSGKRVFTLAAGDLRPSDFLTRIASMVTEIPLSEVYLDLHENMEKAKHYLKGNLDISCVPSQKVTAKEYVNYCLDRIDDYDVFMLDYDANLATDSDSMYEAGGVLYDLLTEITSYNKLVFVASQPKIHTWSQEVLGLDSLNESSRKQHILDVVITLSRAKGANHVGIMNIAKNRRGDLASSPVILSSCGKFVELSQEKYQLYNNNPNKLTKNELLYRNLVAESGTLDGYLESLAPSPIINP